jgi:hypothetical protein
MLKASKSLDEINNNYIHIFMKFYQNIVKFVFEISNLVYIHFNPMNAYKYFTVIEIYMLKS